MIGDETYDVFVCHASEDKLRFVEPLVVALQNLGVRCWYDRFEIKPGDNIAAKINEGLAKSRCGVVVLSPRFWKYWTGEEVGALHALESLNRDHPRRIIPVWCEVELIDIARKAPLLAGRLGIHWGLGAEAVARELSAAIGGPETPPVAMPPGLGRARLYNAPERPPSQTFEGREEDMAKLDALLTPGAQVRVAAAVEGLFGIGKTELALQMAHRLADSDRFPGGIFWLDAAQPDLTPQWGVQIAELMAIGSGSDAERARSVLRVVESNGPVLVILDNVENWTKETKPQPMPTGPRVTLLVTTRLRDFGGASFQHLTLDVLKRDAAHKLLLAIAGPGRVGDPGVDDLLTYLHGHALAIELAAAYLKKYPTVSVVEYLTQLRADRPVEEKVADKVRYEATVRAEFKAIYAKLNEAARRALRVCGCFADADASIELLRACGIDLDAEATLRDMHLIAGGATRWTMHRLVREHARRGMSETERGKIREVFWTGCRTLLDKPRPQAAAFRSDRIHYENFAERAMGGIEIPPAIAHSILVRVGRAARAAGALASATRFDDRASALSRDLQQAVRGGDARVELMFADGRTLELLDPSQNHLPVAHADSELAWSHLLAGRYDAALALFEQVGRTLEPHRGPAEAMIRAVRDGQVQALLGLGRTKDAMRIAKDLLSTARKHRGEDSVAAALARMMIGRVLITQKKYGEAVALFRSVVSDLERRGDAATDLYGQVLACLGYASDKLGEHREGIKQVERAVAIVSAVNGESHHATFQMRMNLAVMLMNAEDPAGARQQLALTEAVAAEVDQGHPSVMLRKVVLAKVLVAEGDPEAAKEAAFAAREAASVLPPTNLFRKGIERDIAKIFSG